MNCYEERLAELLSAMDGRSYAPILKGDRGKALSVLQRHLDTMSRYIDCVYEHESLEARLASEGGADLRDAMELANRRRTAAHDAAMGSLRAVNRVFEGYGLAPFIEIGQHDTRSDIGEKIAAYVSVMFLGCDTGLGRTEAAILAHDSGIVHARRSEMLAAWLASAEPGASPSERHP